MGRLTMPGGAWTYPTIWHPAIWISVAALLSAQGVGGAASAQVSQYISNSPGVVVDLEVLESLGGPPLVVDRPAAARAPITVQRMAPPLQPAPQTAPRSRLNSDALARLGLTAGSPVAAPAAVPRAPVVATRATPAPKPAPPPAQTAVVRQQPAAPATPAAATGATGAATTAARTGVPERPVLPPVNAPAPAPSRQATTRQATTPPAPPAPPTPPVTTAATPSAATTARAQAPAASAAATQQAARATTAAETDGNAALRLLFDDGSAKLPDAAQARLQSLTQRLNDDEALQVQLVAYAAGTAETSSQARRLSLSRALAVRSYLIDKGVRSTRMDVRALGNKAEDGPADRVDVVLVQK